MNYTCHSGGCPGADMEWEREGEKYGVKTIAYSFHGHVQEGKNPFILMGKELDEGWKHVLIADKTLKKDVETNLKSTYGRSLLCRNWFQVKNSDVVFAIGLFENATQVKGGTGWAVQMAIDNGKFVYVFDQQAGKWSWYHPSDKLFVYTDKYPRLTENFDSINFAGIGTRDINEFGKDAIKRVYHETFTVSYNEKMEGSGFRKLSLYKGN